MSATEVKVSRQRGIALWIAMALGIAGGAIADTLVSLRHGSQPAAAQTVLESQ